MHPQTPSENLPYWQLLQELREGQIVDLSHPFDEHIPHFEEADPLVVETVKTYQKDGISAQRFHFEGGWGTHVDAPAHFCEGKRTLDQIPAKELILPLVVLDITDKVIKNPDYALTVDDILGWEDTYRRIPMGSFVALRTGWSSRWPDQKAMYNKDSEGISHTPGWSLEALEYLYEGAAIAASGQETIDPDPGIYAKASNWGCERYILSRDCFQIDLMANLDKCPPIGALIICACPRPIGGVNFPSRIIALCPK